MTEALVTEDARWWAMNDHRAVVEIMRQTEARHVLEFGPGTSTLSLIEGGATSIDTCEDDPEWAAVYEERLVKRFPGIMRLHRYQWAPQLAIPTVDENIYDLALIDGPHGAERRPAALRYAMGRALWVLMPTEDGATETPLRPIIRAIAEEAGRHVEFLETGPLSGGFALVGPC